MASKLTQQQDNLSKPEQEALKQARLVWQMAEHKGWSEVVLPYLTDKLNQSFPDPSKFTKEEEFVYAAKVTSVFKKVIAEILGWVDQKVQEAKYLEKKEKGEIKEKFEIGGE